MFQGPGRSVTRAKHILKADKNTTEGRDSGAAGQICNTSKTYKKIDTHTCFRD